MRFPRIVTAQVSASTSVSVTIGGLDENGMYMALQLEDGRWLCVDPLLFDRARLGLSWAAGPTAREALEQGFGFGEIWEYDSLEDAIAALLRRVVRGEAPTGWRRHPVGAST